jgi:hypothetical protein
MAAAEAGIESSGIPLSASLTVPGLRGRFFSATDHGSTGALRPGSEDNLLLGLSRAGGEQIGDMRQSHAPGCYRVRPADRNETTVPNEAIGPILDDRDAAERYARNLVLARQAPVIVEKLAPAGCWLQLSIVG